MLAELYIDVMDPTMGESGSMVYNVSATRNRWPTVDTKAGASKTVVLAPMFLFRVEVNMLFVKNVFDDVGCQNKRKSNQFLVSCKDFRIGLLYESYNYKSGARIF